LHELIFQQARKLFFNNGLHGLHGLFFNSQILDKQNNGWNGFHGLIFQQARKLFFYNGLHGLHGLFFNSQILDKQNNGLHGLHGLIFQQRISRIERIRHVLLLLCLFLTTDFTNCTDYSLILKFLINKTTDGTNFTNYDDIASAISFLWFL